MRQRVGRKPLATAHVNHLFGSTHAKNRLRMFLETIRGQVTIPEACAFLELSEAQFHHVRNQWMQVSLEILEPRTAGRRPKAVDPAEIIRERDRLAAEVAELRAQLQGAAIRQEIAQILSEAGEPQSKKNDQQAGPRHKAR